MYVSANQVFDTKTLSELAMVYCKFDPMEQIWKNLNQSFNIFVQENTFENVFCKMGAMLSRPQCVECFFTNELKVLH